MSAKKRNRKDKLVPRDFNLDVEKGNSTQEQPCMELVNVKPEPLAEESLIYSSLSHLQFSVNIKVEEYNECDIKQEPLDSNDAEVIEILDNDTDHVAVKCHKTNDARKPAVPVKRRTAVKTKRSKVQKAKHKSDEKSFKEYVLSTVKIARELRYLRSPSLADKLMSIEVRNMLGHTSRQPILTDKYDKMIEAAFSNSKAWYYISKHGEYPTFYKCYICYQAWWHLYDFRQHVKRHMEPHFKIHFEDDFQLFSTGYNIIAFEYSIPEVTNIPIDGLCWQCNLDFAHHILRNGLPASCEQCKEKLDSCRMQLRHINTCPKAVLELKLFLCVFCLITFKTKDSLSNHMKSYHSVRSDIISTTYCKACLICKEKYIHYNVHPCPKKKVKHVCMFCHRRFVTSNLAEVHGHISKPGNCPICQEKFKKSCMITSHIAVKHSANFVIAYKCLLCAKFLVCLNIDYLKRHMKKKHYVKYDRRRTGVVSVILPKTCFDPHFKPVTDQRVEINHVSLVGNTGHKVTQHQTEVGTQTSQASAVTSPVPVRSVLEMEMAQIIETEHLDRALPDPEPEQPAITEIKDEGFGIDVVEVKTEVKEEPMEDSETEQSVGTTEFESIVGVLNGRLPKMYTCNKCGFIDVHKQYRWHIDNNCRSFNNDKYTCTLCGNSFRNLVKYLQHFYRHGVPCLTCPECRLTFKEISKLTYHVNMHTKYNFIKINLLDKGESSKKCHCRQCMSSVEVSEYFTHWESHLAARLQGKSTGAVAVASVDTVSALEPDVLKALTGRLQLTESVKQMALKGCIVCEKRFVRHNDSKRHIIEHLLTDAYANRPANKMLKCQICGDGFEKHQRFKYHMRIHGALTLYKCEICDKSFSDSSNFSKHKKLHNMKVFVCDKCSKKFVNKSSLEKHILDHRKYTPTNCQECNQVFYSASAYRKHMKAKHSKVRNKYRCVICNEKFDSLKKKWDHLWLVHKERKNDVDCNLCDKSFRRRLDLRAHLRNDHQIYMSRRHYHKSHITASSLKQGNTKKKCGEKREEVLNSVTDIVIKKELSDSDTEVASSAIRGVKVISSENNSEELKGSIIFNANGMTYSVMPSIQLEKLPTQGLETLVFFE